MASNIINNTTRPIPFSNLIGGPLKACIDAQAQAAQSTKDYIFNTGFTYNQVTDEHQTVMVTFIYEHNGENCKLSVPLISIVPMPFMQIDNVKIRFTAEMSLDNNDNLMAKYSSASSVNVVNEVTQTSRYNQRSQLDVEVYASNPVIPPGLSKLLEILNNTIKVEDVDGTP